MEHWQLYWKQQTLFQKILKPGDSILEIGVGSGFTANYLRSKGYDVMTVDIDENKHPDRVMNIATELINSHHDVVSAFEVFEHIPLKYLRSILSNIRATRLKYLLVSLPDRYPSVVFIQGKLPILKKINFSFRRPKILPEQAMTDHHHWEVNMNDDVTVESLEKHFKDGGFNLIVYELFMDRHFFVFGTNQD